MIKIVGLDKYGYGVAGRTLLIFRKAFFLLKFIWEYDKTLSASALSNIFAFFPSSTVRSGINQAGKPGTVWPYPCGCSRGHSNTSGWFSEKANGNHTFDCCENLLINQCFCLFIYLKSRTAFFLRCYYGPQDHQHLHAFIFLLFKHCRSDSQKCLNYCISNIKPTNGKRESICTSKWEHRSWGY